ncbi:hypothetical protein OX284_013775 [Flavobacterium sp. SUN046]|uniref:hypothetical protein n=1 Tax=Flavobacterium sp. SUN046 TaxID=3002440 RepID=UPI002DBF6887|nr:hypothetical protein [Flavobacterium sp. SUN046]MEC4050507.1 hypothetical protein [Flavobacterium sp. SUN046]
MNKNNQFVGRIGNVVFKQIGKTIIVQSSPHNIKQTIATKKSSNEFLQCSTWAKHLRNCLKPFLNDCSDTFMYKRFTSAVYNAIQQNNSLPKGERSPLNSDMSYLNGFEFNINSPLSNSLFISATISLNNQNQIQINLPEFDPKTAVNFPKNICDAELIFYIIASNMVSGKAYEEMFIRIPIHYDLDTIPETSWSSTEIPSEHLIVVCSKLFFYKSSIFTSKEYINSKAFNPSQIVYVEKSN